MTQDVLCRVLVALSKIHPTNKHECASERDFLTRLPQDELILTRDTLREP